MVKNLSKIQYIVSFTYISIYLPYEESLILTIVKIMFSSIVDLHFY